MFRATLALGKRLVGDVPYEILEEAVLAVLGRARVGLHTEDLLAYERSEQRLEIYLGDVRERRERATREGLAQYGPVLQQPALFGGQAVEARCDQRVQCLRHFERLDRTRWPVDRAVEDKQPAVEQHAHRLDRVERDALGAREDLLVDLAGQTRH